jgi:hypothetical protein
MKMLKKIRFNGFVAWVAALLLAVSWIIGATSILSAAAEELPQLFFRWSRRVIKVREGERQELPSILYKVSFCRMPYRSPFSRFIFYFCLLKLSLY